MPPAKDLVFIAGVLVLLLVCVALALPDPKTRYRYPARNKERAQGAHLVYVVGVLDLLALVNVFAFRRGLVEHLDVPEVWSWVLAPLGLLLLVAVSILTGADELFPGATWLLPLVGFLALFFCYAAVAVGPATFWERLTTPAA